MVCGVSCYMSRFVSASLYLIAHPVALSLPSELFIMASHAFYCLDTEVTERVAHANQASRFTCVRCDCHFNVYWGECGRVLCFSGHILFVALPAFDEVDDFAGGRGTCVVADPGDFIAYTLDGCSRLHHFITIMNFFRLPHFSYPALLKTGSLEKWIWCCQVPSFLLWTLSYMHPYGLHVCSCATR